MSQPQRAGLAIVGLIIALAGLWVFWGSGQFGNSQQDQVLSDLTEVVEQGTANTSTEEPVGEDSGPVAETTSTVSDEGQEPPAEQPTSTTSVTSTTTESEPTEGEPTEPEDTTTTSTVDAEVEGDEAELTTTTEDRTTSTEATTAAPNTTETTAAPSTTETTTSQPETTTATPAAPGTPAVASFDIIETIPHDTGAFTQGLEISNGRLFESTGLVGRSSIRELDLQTGEIIRNTAVPEVFGEGLTIVGDTAIQITWQDQIAFRYDLDTFDVIESYEYEGQGWGLCLASEGSGDLIMSDGSSELEFRDPDTFESLGFVDVRLDGAPIENLNELECIGDTVWANIWLSSLVIEIDPATGDVLTVLDIDSLRPESTDGDSGAVWNGLAYDPTNGTLLVTGKLWPTIFRLDLSTN